MEVKLNRRAALKNLYIMCEGRSEVEFINFFFKKQIKNVYIKADARLQKGGINFKNIISKSRNQLKSEPSCFVTTFVDYYGTSDFVGFKDQDNNIYQKIKNIEQKISKEVNNERFIPYIQLHEFETLLFSNLHIMENYDRITMEDIKKLERSVSNFSNIEKINGSFETSPSHRLESFLEKYDIKFNDRKMLKTYLVAFINKIDFSLILEKCKHFNEWYHKLQTI